MLVGLHQVSLEAAFHIPSLLQPSYGVPQGQHYARPLTLLLGQSSLTTYNSGSQECDGVPKSASCMAAYSSPSTKQPDTTHTADFSSLVTTLTVEIVIWMTTHTLVTQTAYILYHS